jgi:hypothetical protein
MTRDNADQSNADQQSTQYDAIQDLSGESLTIEDAAQVKGGFNPQPDPPRVPLEVSQISAKFSKK